MPKALFLILALALAAVLVQNRARIRQALQPSAPVAAEVVMYATEWCGYCAKTRQFFRDRGIAYEERDIEKSDTARAEHEKLGGPGVPVVVVNGRTVIRGYDPDRLEEALGL
jgi:glutaredoxin-like YruB-family protein